MISRQKLYALGEPFGECATMAKPGGGRICGGGGGGGSSSSTTSTATTTTNTDKRVVADSGAQVISADGGANVTVNATDAGAVKAGTGVALAAIGANSTNLDHLLATADHLLSNQQQIQKANVDLVGQLNNSAMAAYADSASQASGNKNLILAGLAVVAIVATKALK